MNVNVESNMKQAERERGDAVSSILCYMNQKDASEEKARKHIQDMIHKAWKKMNGHVSGVQYKNLNFSLCAVSFLGQNETDDFCYCLLFV